MIEDRRKEVAVPGRHRRRDGSVCDYNAVGWCNKCGSRDERFGKSAERRKGER